MYSLLGSVADVTHELEVVQVDLVRVDIPKVANIAMKKSCDSISKRI